MPARGGSQAANHHPGREDQPAADQHPDRGAQPGVSIAVLDPVIAQSSTKTTATATATATRIRDQEGSAPEPADRGHDPDANPRLIGEPRPDSLPSWGRLGEAHRDPGAERGGEADKGWSASCPRSRRPPRRSARASRPSRPSAREPRLHEGEQELPAPGRDLRPARHPRQVRRRQPARRSWLCLRGGEIPEQLAWRRPSARAAAALVSGGPGPSICIAMDWPFPVRAGAPASPASACGSCEHAGGLISGMLAETLLVQRDQPVAMAVLRRHCGEDRGRYGIGPASLSA